MIIDIMGALLFLSVGFCIRDLLDPIDFYTRWTLRPGTPKWRKRSDMATKHCEETELLLYGKAKMDWFWSRQMEEDEELRMLPLREYARRKSGMDP